ncbi:hypothetical protein BC831DRAFT_445968 [Entophlyctis helioformis]|nr:hypothetical protein BC831DRAFT_445968 [Entophlyctis helioformis]
MATPLTLSPGNGLGRLALGLPLPAVIAYLKRESLQFSKYELKFSDKTPFDYDVVLNLIHNGLALRFDPLSQRLKSIELYDFDKLSLTYEGALFNSPTIVPTFLLIYKLFGPTYPGEYDADKLRYTLKYPGVSFVFPIPQQFAPLKNLADLPISFPDGTTPVVSRIYLYSSNPAPVAAKPSTPTPAAATTATSSSASAARGGGNGRKESSNATAGGPEWKHAIAPRLGPFDTYFERVVIKPGFGLQFPDRGGQVCLQATCQDVLGEMGRPEDVTTKQRDKMGIHRNGSGEQGPLSTNPDYVWNYFSMGIDMVFDGTTHRVKKMILHSNMLGHHHVNLYARCNFEISSGTAGTGSASASASAPASASALGSSTASPSNGTFANAASRNVGSSSKAMGSKHTASTPLDLTAKWDKVQEQLGKPLGPPVIFNPSPNHNPFGSTSYYAIGHMVFEIMKNGYMASVMIV